LPCHPPLATSTDNDPFVVSPSTSPLTFFNFNEPFSVCARTVPFIPSTLMLPLLAFSSRFAELGAQTS
jgi:hypothetical protein